MDFLKFGFCPVCGAKLNAPVITFGEETVKAKNCPTCGTIYFDGDVCRFRVDSVPSLTAREIYHDLVVYGNSFVDGEPLPPDELERLRKIFRKKK